MIPITSYTMKAVAALIYNSAYEQDPDTGWQADDEHSAPGDEANWLAWSACLIQALQEQATDEQVLALAKSRMNKRGSFGWNTIWMHQTEDGDRYSTMSSETNTVMPLVRDFLEKPENYVEISFIEDDPEYRLYLETPA